MAPVERVMIQLPRELLDKLTAIARRKGLSRASYIRMVLTEDVNKQEGE
jgi:metal-responsive CopG/Arc/MetJ family transcriptional regulator